MARKVGFSDYTPLSKEDAQARVARAVVRYALLDSILVFALLGALLYLYTDMFGEHDLSTEQVTTYAVAAVAVMGILSGVLFYFTVWPALREARNAK